MGGFANFFGEISGLIGVPQPGLFLSAADFYPKIAKRFQIPYAGEILSDILEDSDLKSDTVHPNAQGYRLLAHTLAQLLKRAQAIDALASLS